ncbi:MAG: IS5 family transposase [bacterium]
MLGKSPDQKQKNLFQPLLKEFINPDHELVILAERIPWEELEDEFRELYSDTGQPSKPVRLMAGLLILKQMYDLGDETIMPVWVQNPYYQYFCGEAEFQWNYPCDPTDLVHFRKRIGESGVEKILELSVRLQPKKDLRSKDVIVDSTVQEKNITYPTDTKLYVKIIDRSNKIAKKEGIALRQSYKRTTKQLLLKQRFAHHPKRRKEAVKAQKKLRTIAGRLTRELERKLPEERLKLYLNDLELFKKVLAQERFDKDKIYSLHEPDTACIAKGKASKKYEYGSKVSFAMLPGSNIIVGVVNYKGNPHDSTTLEGTLNHCRKILGREFNNAIVDRGYRGKKRIGKTNIISPGPPIKNNEYQRRKKRRQCRSRAAIEPVIEHIKDDCGMARNYLKGTIGDEMNAILSAAAFNFRRLLRVIEQEIIFPVFGKIFFQKKLALIFQFHEKSTS